ncbi:hypothetical protein T06_5797 [Trichinella sp. T6]|nr:hypothetical protein T06_5797 [Trichinella sp. T6]
MNRYPSHTESFLGKNAYSAAQVVDQLLNPFCQEQRIKPYEFSTSRYMTCHRAIRCPWANIHHPSCMEEA